MRDTFETLLLFFCSISVNLISVGSSTCSAKLGESVSATAISDSADFALNLYKKAREIAENRSTNIFLSPVSIFLAVGMVNLGAKGATSSEILSVSMPNVNKKRINDVHACMNLELNSQEKSYHLYTANAAFIEKNQTVLKKFLHKLENCFQSQVHTVDFENDPNEARLEINEWVEDQTNDKITDLIPEGAIDSDSKMVLTNAIYFKGEWEKPFVTANDAYTHNSSFYPQLNIDENSPHQQTEFMNMKSHFLYHQTDDVQVLGIPYKNNELTMFIFLPSGTLAEFEQKLEDGSSLSDLMGQVSNQTVDVSIPKFKFSATMGLKQALREMGMSTMFTNFADFSGITGDRTLKVGGAFHKAFVEVNEKGTEAAAATALVFTLRAMLNPPPSFVANHPFLFLIRHEATGAYLFMGSLNDADSLE